MDRFARAISSPPAATMMGLWSCDVLFQPVFMMQAAKDRTRHHLAMCRPSMPLLLQERRQPRKRLGNTWPQGHMRATCVVMAYPLREDAPHMGCREGNQVIHAFPPQRADEPLAERI